MEEEITPTSGLIAAFAADMRSRNLTTETAEVYMRILLRFEEFLGPDRPLDQIGRQDLQEYLDYLRGKNVSHKTASCYFGGLSAFYEYLVYEGSLATNPVTAVRKRYLQTYKARKGHTHQIVSVQDASRLVSSMIDIGDKARLLTLFKTGIRRRELVSLELEDLDLVRMRITLKPTAKRSNRVVFFDDETADLLERWLAVRSYRVPPENRWLWPGNNGGHIKGGSVARTLRMAATRMGLHDPTSPNMEDHFSPHCARHWFTTILDRAGMKREHIELLRGDVGKGAIDLYIHNDLEEIRKEYLRCMPRLLVGV